MSKEKSWDYYFDNREKLIREHAGYFLLLKDGNFCALYPDQRAVTANKEKFGGDLLILHLLPEGLVEVEG